MCIDLNHFSPCICTLYWWEIEGHRDIAENEIRWKSQERRFSSVNRWQMILRTHSILLMRIEACIFVLIESASCWVVKEIKKKKRLFRYHNVKKSNRFLLFLYRTLLTFARCDVDDILLLVVCLQIDYNIIFCFSYQRYP